MHINLSSSVINNQTIDYVKRAINRGEISNYGENIDSFHRQLELYFSKNTYVALLNSGTSAIHLALIGLGVQEGDEVICQNFTFVATANPILYQGAIPIFIDSEKATWNMCPNLLEEAIIDRNMKGRKPKAIIFVHSYGMPAKADEIISIANKYEIPLIEDAAEAMGSTYKGQKCGTFGNYGIVSFNGNKMISTSGGGALICKDKSARDKALFLANQAKEKAPFYQHSQIGYNYKMSNVLAGFGRAQMDVLEENILSRRKMNEFYKTIFKLEEGITFLEEPNKEYYSNHWLSCILIDDKITGFSREDLRLELKKHKIESRPLWKPMHMQPIFNKNNYYNNGISENLFEKGLCLPSGSNLLKAEMNKIKKVILNFLKK